MNDEEFEIIQEMLNEEYDIATIETIDTVHDGKLIKYIDHSENYLWITGYTGTIKIIATNQIESIILTPKGDGE